MSYSSFAWCLNYPLLDNWKVRFLTPLLSTNLSFLIAHSLPNIDALSLPRYRHTCIDFPLFLASLVLFLLTLVLRLLKVQFRPMLIRCLTAFLNGWNSHFLEQHKTRFYYFHRSRWRRFHRAQRKRFSSSIASSSAFLNGPIPCSLNQSFS